MEINGFKRDLEDLLAMVEIYANTCELTINSNGNIALRTDLNRSLEFTELNVRRNTDFGAIAHKYLQPEKWI